MVETSCKSSSLLRVSYVTHEDAQQEYNVVVARHPKVSGNKFNFSSNNKVITDYTDTTESRPHETTLRPIGCNWTRARVSCLSSDS